MIEPALIELPQITTADLPSVGWPDWLLTQVSGTFDGAMLRAMSMVVDAFIMPKANEVDALRASAQHFVRGPLWQEPRRFLTFAGKPGAPATTAPPMRPQ